MFSKPDVNLIWAVTGGVISPSTAKISQGWIAEIPDFEFENWIQNRQDQFNAHVNQFGIPEWDSQTEYIAGRSYVQSSTGVVYRAVSTNTNSAPTDANSDWVRAFDSFQTSYAKSESDIRYLQRSNNLSDLSNTTTARTNLNVYSKTEGDGRYLQRSNNLSDLSNVTTARNNLGLGTAATRDVGVSASNVLQTSDADGRYMRGQNNLSELTNTTTARTNLNVYSKTEGDGRYLQRSNNLSDLNNSATARTNLNVYSKTEGDGRYLQRSNNLSDLSNKAAARANLNVYSKTESDSAYLNQLTLTGMVAPFAMNSAPSGWLPCDGSAVSRSTYLQLFNKIGTLYGSGNGSTTFNLPDLRDDFIRGASATRPVGNRESDEIKSHTHTATTSSTGSHRHSGTTDSDGAHTHTKSVNNSTSGSTHLQTSGGGSQGTITSANSAGAHTHTFSTNTTGAHTHTVTVNSTGGSETRPRNVALLYCIKT